MHRYLITGGAGFIGSRLIRTLFQKKPGISVVNIDNYDNFYSRDIKEKNTEGFDRFSGYSHIQKDISLVPAEEIAKLVPSPVDVIIHLAARAGVRQSIEDPYLYHQHNITGTQHLLDFARINKVAQFVFASSSSVYGVNNKYPWTENAALLPISPYAMSKVAGEALGHVYSHLYNIRFIALRLFTVYGPGQRPDLAIHKFTKSILNEQPIVMYGDGSSSRDYTYVQDIVDGIIAAASYDKSPFEIFNLGNNRGVSLISLIRAIEQITGVKAQIMQFPEQAGDVPRTAADITKAATLLGYAPGTKLDEGISRFYDWFLQNRDLLSGKRRSLVSD